MEKYQGVAITDGVNRKNHILPLNAIIKAYRDTWNNAKRGMNGKQSLKTE